MTELPRQTAAETYGQALDWLSGLPALVGLFAVVLLAGTVGTLAVDALLGTDATARTVVLVATGFRLVALTLFLLGGGVAYHYADRLSAGQRVRRGGDELFDAVVAVSQTVISLLGVFVVFTMAVTAGLLLVLPGLYLAARLVLAFPACVLDDEGILASISTSWDVADGNLRKIAGLFVLFFLALFVAGLVGFVLSEVVSVVTGPGNTFALAVTQVTVATLVGVAVCAFQLSLGRVYLENR